MLIFSNNSKKAYINISIFVSIIFSLLVGSGVYGFGNDWYAAYFKSNLDWNHLYRDQLGWRISTLTIFGSHVGVYVTSFILSLSTGFLLGSILSLKKIKSNYYFALIFIMAIHTWPVIMSTSNAMRQGLSMSFIFLFMSSYIEDRKLLGLIFLIFAVFTHTAGPFYFIIYFTMLFLLYVNRFFEGDFPLQLVYLAVSIVISILIFFLLNIYSPPLEGGSRIIQGDFRLPFLMINTSYIIFFTYNFKMLKNNPVNIYLYIFSFIALVLLFLGYNWQYERFCMMMLIPYILIFGFYLNKTYSIIFWFINFGLLLSLTFYTGMYASLK